MSEEKVLQLYCNNIAKAEAAMREAKSAGRAFFLFFSNFDFLFNEHEMLLEYMFFLGP